jgi:hypothetical protein
VEPERPAAPGVGEEGPTQPLLPVSVCERDIGAIWGASFVALCLEEVRVGLPTDTNPSTDTTPSTYSINPNRGGKHQG